MKKTIFTLLTLAIGFSAFAASEDLASQIYKNDPTLPLTLIQRSLNYLNAHSSTFKNQEYMGIVNYDLPSTKRRFYIINLKTAAVEKHLVAHGKNSSDPHNRARAIRFSNKPGSDMSSLGFLRTFSKGEVTRQGDAGIYFEKGYWRSRLRGLQSTNNNVEKRDIVIHAGGSKYHSWGFGSYVSTAYIKAHGYLGESEGCLAVSPDVEDDVIKKLEGGALILTYSALGTND